MKPVTLKSRRGSAADDEEAPGGGAEYSFLPTPRKEYCCSSSGLLKAVAALVILMAGVLIGLAARANYYYYSSIESSSSSSLQAAAAAGRSSADSNSNGIPATRSSSTKRGRREEAAAGRASISLLDFRRFVDPGPPWGHSMSDSELFWRASMAPRMEEYPFQRVPKVAFLFLTRGPLPFAPLWERFFRGHEGLYSVYVHALPGYAGRHRRSSPFHGRQIPSQQVSWGSITLVDAEKRLDLRSRFVETLVLPSPLDLERRRRRRKPRALPESSLLPTPNLARRPSDPRLPCTDSTFHRLDLGPGDRTVATSCSFSAGHRPVYSSLQSTAARRTSPTAPPRPDCTRRASRRCLRPSLDCIERAAESPPSTSAGVRAPDSPSSPLHPPPPVAAAAHLPRAADHLPSVRRS